MIAALTGQILPIFAVLAAGFALARTGLFDAGQATAVNRFVFFLAAPALVFAIFARAPLDDLQWTVLASYFGAEVVIYGTVALVARRVFGLDWAEAVLLGMAAVFSNHVFFVLPVAINTYGPDIAGPIGGIIIVDIVSFCATTLIVDALTNREGGMAATALNLLKNPFVYAPMLGVLAWWLGPLVPPGLFTFADFAGASAAPVSLFALGVVLAGLRMRFVGAVVALVVLAKLAAHPVLTWGGVAVLGGDPLWSKLAVLLAAGPCGAMPFVIALQYGVTTERIAKAALLSSVLSVFSLSLLL